MDPALAGPYLCGSKKLFQLSGESGSSLPGGKGDIPMKFKHVLLTSTAVLMLGTPVAPLFAQGSASFAVAQAAPPALAGAIQTYLDAQAAVEAARQSGGDVTAAEAALASAEQELASL